MFKLVNRIIEIIRELLRIKAKANTEETQLSDEVEDSQSRKTAEKMRKLLEKYGKRRAKKLVLLIPFLLPPTLEIRSQVCIPDRDYSKLLKYTAAVEEYVKKVEEEKLKLRRHPEENTKVKITEVDANTKTVKVTISLNDYDLLEDRVVQRKGEPIEREVTVNTESPRGLVYTIGVEAAVFVSSKDKVGGLIGIPTIGIVEGKWTTSLNVYYATDNSLGVGLSNGLSYSSIRLFTGYFVNLSTKQEDMKVGIGVSGRLW